jgi:predicted nucleic acid-binding protein
MTFFEKRRGWERRKKDDPALATARLTELDALESAFRDRMVPIDGAVVAEWTRLLGAKDKNQRDKALAATAVVHDYILVTRNVVDIRGCNIQVLNPFKAKPVIEIVLP